jgi:hypothetical protein
MARLLELSGTSAKDPHIRLSAADLVAKAQLTPERDAEKCEAVFGRHHALYLFD